MDNQPITQDFLGTVINRMANDIFKKLHIIYGIIIIQVIFDIIVAIKMLGVI